MVKYRIAKAAVNDYQNFDICFVGVYTRQTSISKENDDFIFTRIFRTRCGVAHRLRCIIDYDMMLVMDAGRPMEYDDMYALIANKDSLFCSMRENSGTGTPHETFKASFTSKKNATRQLPVRFLKEATFIARSHFLSATVFDDPVTVPAKDLESESSETLLESETGAPNYLQEPEEAPQGRHLGLFSTIILFVSRILGSGYLAISSGMYNDCGRSPFIFLASWLVASVLAFCGLFVYLELGSLIPRSGGTKAFLEFIYDKPFMMTSVVISLYSVMFGFTILNLLVFGEYCLHALNIEASVFRIRLTGLTLLYVVCAFHGISVKHGVRVQDFIGVMKLGLAGIIVATGIWVNVFPYSVTKIDYQMTPSQFFPVKTEVSFSLFASAVIKATFAYSGWNSVHTVTNEIKDPARTLKIAGPVALSVITITYLVINFTYLAVIPNDDIANSGQLIGSILFEKVFGYHFGRQFLTMSSAVSTGGNVFVVLYTISRVSQEVFREGYLPFSSFMASNWPRDAPLPTLLLSCAVSTFIIAASPDGDVYNYVVSLESYPQQIFVFLCAIGIFILRKKYPEVVSPIRSSAIGTILVILISAYLIVLPLAAPNPNPPGMSGWIPYTYLGLLCLFVCFLYWLGMFLVCPWLAGYTLLAEEFRQDDGLIVRKWIKSYVRDI